MHTDPHLPPVFTRAEATQYGLTRHQADHRARSGHWVTLCRGTYAEASAFARRPATEQHALRAVAVLGARADDASASHVTAASLRGWSLPLEHPVQPWITRGDLRRSARHDRHVVVQVATLPATETARARVEVDGWTWTVGTTGPARTAADCLRHLPLGEGVALVDSALRIGDVSSDEVRSC
ncbi:hypothetical protein GCM10025868_28030 [Angustibacter aerolatus]|uniref:AbiEi antitoxin N-terminal domain-containing protein n=1 Tax=Angustibacter aerolatus TaxID=1162965 RepID=A0ABQ6JH86_9ACTN|nr:type IV toxin-antitoxin system AbiEi family antitoxin domain-containing protein [Angustibacter aerolatus]GMA87553.1 hypothetical protein GCM10025868_28030 [Angustibacter aerolatus]